MGKQVLYFLLPGLLSTYWLKDWSWVFLTVESLLNTTGFLNRSAAFCDRSARCSSVPFCWEKNRHTTVPFVYKREDINLKGTFLWGDRTQLLQSGFHSSGCGLYWMEVSAAGEKSRRVINFCFFFCCCCLICGGNDWLFALWAPSCRTLYFFTNQTSSLWPAFASNADFKQKIAPLHLCCAKPRVCCCQVAASLPPNTICIILKRVAFSLSPCLVQKSVVFCSPIDLYDKKN